MPRGSKPGEHRGGRKKGTPNKTSASAKAALVQAFEEVGGVKALVKWGKEFPAPFFALWGKLLPTEIGNADGAAFRVTLGEDVRRRLAEVDGDDDDTECGGPGQPGEAGGAAPAQLEDAPPPPTH